MIMMSTPKHQGVSLQNLFTMAGRFQGVGGGGKGEELPGNELRPQALQTGPGTAAAAYSYKQSFEFTAITWNNRSQPSQMQISF